MKLLLSIFGHESILIPKGILANQVGITGNAQPLVSCVMPTLIAEIVPDDPQMHYIRLRAAFARQADRTRRIRSMWKRLRPTISSWTCYSKNTTQKWRAKSRGKGAICQDAARDAQRPGCGDTGSQRRSVATTALRQCRQGKRPPPRRALTKLANRPFRWPQAVEQVG